MKRMLLVLVLVTLATPLFATDKHIDSVEVLGANELFSQPHPWPDIQYMTLDLPWEFDEAIEIVAQNDTAIVLYVSTTENPDPEPTHPATIQVALVPLGTTIPTGYTRLGIVQLVSDQVYVGCIGTVTAAY